MGLSSLHACMDTSDWLQGAVNKERRTEMDSTSPPSEDMISGQKPTLQEKRLRVPQQEQAQKCPRCDSTNTKFCYYNNYSLSQPRYFCKTCRRYWTKGGSLRNVPVGGGCRKSKKLPSKRPSHDPSPTHFINTNFHTATDLYLCSGAHNSTDYNPLLGDSKTLNFPDFKLLGCPRNVDLMDNNLDTFFGNSRSFGFIGDSGGLIGGDDVSHGLSSYGLLGLSSPFGYQENYMEMSEQNKLLLPYGGNEDLKPSQKMMSLERQEQSCSEVGKDYTFGGYMMNGLGSWPSLINGHGSSGASASPLL